MKPIIHSRGGLVVRIPAALALVSSLSAGIVTWDNSDSTALWATDTNWDTNLQPTSADDAVFPAGLAGTITLASGEQAKSLQFDDAYTLAGGALSLASASTMTVASGFTATISTPLTVSGGTTKLGAGTLVLGTANSFAGGIAVNAGTLRVGNVSAIGSSANSASVATGATLQVADGITLDRPVALANGGTVAGLGTATNAGKITLDVAATAVTFATDQASDVLIVGNGANDVTGGTSATLIGISGPGAVRLGGASDFDGSWNLPGGRLELGAAAALGDQVSSSVTLSGGTLSARLATATPFTGPAGNLIVTADSGLLSDRSSAGAGVTHTLGALSMGTHVLSMGPGANATTAASIAGIVLGNVTLSGNPTFAVNDAGSVLGKLTIGALLGGAARDVLKTGSGDLAVTGGSTDLPAGSAFTATGGGTIEMLFPNLGGTTPVAITAAQNPFGEATVSVTDGALRLLADGSGTATAQTFQLPSTITLGGAVTLDPDRRSGSNSTKTFELPGLTLAADTVLGMSGNNSYGVRLTGPLALSGDATLQGVPLAGQDCLLTLNGGITGAAGDSLSIAGGTSPLSLTISAAGTYGGGTEMSGGNVTLNAASAFGTGATTLSGGSLIVNTDGALNGTVTITGGTLRVNDTNALAANPVHLNGGTLDFRNNTTAVISTGTFTVSGTSVLSLGNNGSGSSQAFDFPPLDVSGNTTLTVTPLSNFVPNFPSIVLAGDLTLSNSDNVRIQAVSEDAMPRRLVKAGAGTLEMEAAGTYSGGTEVLAGILSVEHASALGSGALTLGAASGTATATAQFGGSQTIANDLVARAGGTGLLTVSLPSGGVTWNGDADLQRAVTINAATGVNSFTGVLGGAGDLVKIGNGEILLGNAANTFGSGGPNSVAASDGTLTTATDGALGDPSNGVTISGAGILKIDGTFTTSRALTAATGVTGSLSITGSNTLTVNSALAGTGTFIKSGTGTLVLDPAVDSSARGAAATSVTGGIVRVQSQHGLSDAGGVMLNGSSGTFEFLSDADTAFDHPVTADGTGTLHADRAIGGSGTSGRHTLGALGMVSGNLTVTGANGYGLSLGAATVSSSNTITNNAPGALRLAAFTGNPGSSNLTQTFGGSGDIEVTGAISEGAGTGNYGITKIGPGTLRFGSSVAEFGRLTTIQDGALDLNGLTYSVNALTFGGAATASGPTIVTGAAGSLELAGDVFFDSITTGQAAGALITGNLGLGAASREFDVENNAIAAADLTVDGPIGGSPGAAILKVGTGTLRLAGAGNTQPGLVTVTAGTLELAKSGGDAIGGGGLSLANSGTVVRLAANDQINSAATIAVGNSALLELNDFTDATGAITLTQTTATQNNAVKTGPAGTLVLHGNLTFHNNTDTGSTSERNLLVTGSGTKSAATTTGTLDLGGATRTISVNSTAVTNVAKANATIETQIVNGGILKTGPRTLYLSNTNNTFAGGLQIAGGFVKPGGFGSLGSGPVSFSNTPGVAAGIDFGTLAGTSTEDFEFNGSGDVTFTYSALAPNTLTLSGNFDTSQNLIFDVVNGTTEEGDTATLDLAGAIDDAAAAIGVTKTGNGTLKLAAGNTFSGSVTVQKGILSIAADSALGDTAAALTIDGGCLRTTTSHALPRDLVFGASGGSVMVGAPALLELAGDVAWGSGTTGFFGTGSTVLSGTTSGTGGDLQLGEPTAFAAAPSFPDLPQGHVLSLRGTAALPSGNLSLSNNAVLELGSGDFTRALGTAAGEVQLVTADGGGWAAHGADRIVNLGGAGTPVVWGLLSPPFLAEIEFGNINYGDLILGSATATHRVDFQNPIELDNGQEFFIRRVVVPDGPASVEARISGGIGQSADPELTFTSLELDVAGTLEVSGPISGGIHLVKLGAGTVTLGGTNTRSGSLDVEGGTLVAAGDASWNDPAAITIGASAELDVSALGAPVGTVDGGSIALSGTLTGDLSTDSYISGTGTVDGNLHILPGGYVYPELDGQLHVTGDFTHDATAYIDFFVDGLVPQTDFNRMRVGGAVNLAGEVFLGGSLDLIENDSAVLILNDGTDPISGTFAGLPEGAAIPIGNGLAFQVTYLANGDGGAVGNDFGVTVVPDVSTDLYLAVDAPVAVDLAAPITINYTVENFGPNPMPAGELQITLPANATFVSSTPVGTPDGNLLTIPVPALAVFATTSVELQLTAPGIVDAVFVDAIVSSNSGDPYNFNNSAPSMTAVLAGGCPVLSVFSVDSVNDEMSLGIDALSGVRYLLESSIDLENWFGIEEFIGNGEPYEIIEPMDEDREFFRFKILPYSDGGGGGES